MTRIANHVFAIIVALTLTMVTFNALITIATGETHSPVVIA